MMVLQYVVSAMGCDIMQQLLQTENMTGIEKINRLLDMLCKKCYEIKASDNCIGCMAIDRRIRWQNSTAK